MLEWHSLCCRQAGGRSNGPHHIVTVSKYTRYDRKWNGNRPITRQSEQHTMTDQRSRRLTKCFRLNLLRKLNAQTCIGHEFNAIEIFDQVAARDHADFASRVRATLQNWNCHHLLYRRHRWMHDAVCNATEAQRVHCALDNSGKY